jgi:hypothetical protein
MGNWTWYVPMTPQSNYFLPIHIPFISFLNRDKPEGDFGARLFTSKPFFNLKASWRGGLGRIRIYLWSWSTQSFDRSAPLVDELLLFAGNICIFINYSLTWVCLLGLEYFYYMTMDLAKSCYWPNLPYKKISGKVLLDALEDLQRLPVIHSFVFMNY